jgi:acetyl-CoA acetyltransferase
MSSAVWEFKDRCAVSGIGNTKFSRNSGVSELVMAVEASRAAIRDAGLQSNDIDGIVRNDADHVTHNAIADSLGISDLKYWGVASAGGSAVPSMVGQAVGALLSGQATNVLVYRSLNGRSGTRFGLSRAAAGSGDAPTVVGGQGTLDEYFQPYGLLSAGTFYAMLAQRHMAEFGTTSEQLGAIAMECRIRAHANPNAMMAGRELSLSEYMAGRMLSSPLRLFDYCLETDGACALVVTTTERAADSPAGPVLIRAVAQGMGPGIQAGRMNTTLMRETYTTWPSAYAAKTLYERAGLGPEDIDVAQLYDCFTITVLIQLEDYGFCKKGEGGPFAESGALGLGGSLPINTGGGHLSEGYIHGLNHVVEGVRQIRGSSTSQVPNAEVCLVTGASPPATGALIFRRAS